MVMQHPVWMGKTKNDEIQMSSVKDKQVWSKIIQEQTNSCICICEFLIRNKTKTGIKYSHSELMKLFVNQMLNLAQTFQESDF